MLETKQEPEGQKVDKEEEKHPTREKRWTRQTARRAARKVHVADKARSVIGEFTVGTLHIFIPAFDGVNGMGHSEVALKTYISTEL